MLLVLFLWRMLTHTAVTPHNSHISSKWIIFFYRQVKLTLLNSLKILFKIINIKIYRKNAQILSVQLEELTQGEYTGPAPFHVETEDTGQREMAPSCR